MISENITYSNDFLQDTTLRVSYLINIPSEGILERKIVKYYQWYNMPSDMVKRWRWYFKYRAALLQVKYPKFDVELSYTTSDMKCKTQQIHLLERKIVAKKSKVTEFRNKYESIRARHKELFPVEDHPVYMKYIEIEKIKRTELLELESALSKLLNE